MANLVVLEFEEKNISLALDYAARAVLTGRFPDQGVRLAWLFVERQEELLEILKRKDQPPERLGITLAILTVTESAAEIDKSVELPPKALEICQEILELWKPFLEQDSDTEN